MLTLALKTAKQKWSVRHLGNVEDKMLEARRALEISFNYYADFEKTGNRMVASPFSQSEFEQLIYGILPKPLDEKVKDTNEKWREGILQNYMTSETLTGIKDTRWGALQAITEYGEHVRDYQSANALVMNNHMGDAAKIRDKAFKALVV
jgi:hypothetical protein